MRKSKKLTSMPVISLEEGRQIGTVKGLVVEPVSKKVAALIIEGKRWFKEQKFIPFHKIHSVGDDAVTIEKTSGADKAAGLPDVIKLLKDKINIIGTKIVAENGNVLGYVDEYYVDSGTGTITGLEFSGNFINGVISGRAFLDISYVRTLGAEVTIVSNESPEKILKLDGGLQETVKNIRESTGQFWESTIQKTKNLGGGFHKSPDKKPKDASGSAAADEVNEMTYKNQNQSVQTSFRQETQTHEKTNPDPAENSNEPRKDPPAPPLT
jgi:uncharacterized protein YrrD